MKKIYAISIIILLIGSLSACSNGTIKSEKENIKASKIIVASSIVPESTFIKAVGGDLVQVITMIPPGNSPTNYQPTPKLMEKFSKAKLYFSIGVPTEKANILPRAEELSDSMKIVHLEDDVRKVYKDREFSEGKRDPHIWLSPKRVIVMINTIEKNLSDLDTKHKDIYKKNANEYIDKLKKLDSEIRDSLKNLPNKTFIVYHPSFGYFADDYGLNMIALERNGKKATPKVIEETIELAKKNNIKVIFYQAEIDSSQTNIIANEIKGKSEMIEPLAQNYIENLEKTAKIFKQVLGIDKK